MLPAMPKVASNFVDVWVRRGAGEATEFLLLRRAAGRRLPGLWLPVMGHVEAGESAVAAAVREMREETGLAPRTLHQLDGVHAFFLAATDTVELTPVFSATVEAGASVTLSAEHDASEWLPFERARRTVPWPGQRRCLDELMETIVRQDPDAADAGSRAEVAGGPDEDGLRRLPGLLRIGW